MGYYNELSMEPNSRPFSDEGWSLNDRKPTTLPKGWRIAHYSEPGKGYRTATHSLWITDAPPCERCKGNHPVAICQQPIKEEAPAPVVPTVTKRIGEYDALTKDYPAFVIFEDGQEEYIGSRPTQHDASLLASDYIIQHYTDNHTPETAAQLIHEELTQEGRHEQAAKDQGMGWECPNCAPGLPCYDHEPTWAKRWIAEPTLPSPGATMDEIVEHAWDMRQMPLADEERFLHKETRMSNHTSGPWQQFDDGGRINDRHTYGPEYADCVWGPDGPGHGLIADCSPHGQRATEETIANARLIAAVPDLLATCREVSRILRERDMGGWEARLLGIVDNAIKKATTSPGGS